MLKMADLGPDCVKSLNPKQPFAVRPFYLLYPLILYPADFIYHLVQDKIHVAFNKENVLNISHEIYFCIMR